MEALTNYLKSRYKYQVFLSFRGDTRKGFTDHLHAALLRENIHTYRDDVDLERGENISTELQKAIQESLIAIVVFSKGYASSRWCLDELKMIMELKKTSGLKVLPVFYDVLPSQVRDQSGSFAESFCKFEGVMEEIEDDEKKELLSKRVKEWKVALTEAADLGGAVLQSQFDGHESKFIKEIVEQVKTKLSQEGQKVCTTQGVCACLSIFLFFLFAFPAFYMTVPNMIGGFYKEMFRNNFEVGEDYMFPKMQHQIFSGTSDQNMFPKIKEYHVFSGIPNQGISMVLSLFLLCVIFLLR